MKKTLSIILALTMLLTMSNVFVFADAPAVALPTAATSQLDVSEIGGVDLTFAMNFTANDATAEQLEAYGDWYADFVLTVNKDVTFNADGTKDGYLAGEYGTYGWVTVPAEDVTLLANEPLRIMATAADQLENPALKITCNDVYTFVQDFDCGVYFNDEFLRENRDLKATLELRIYNNENEEESYRIGEQYDFSVEMPTATTSKLDVSEINDVDLTFAMNFLADEVTASQLTVYGDWYADFVLTVDKEVTFNADETKDGYLAGEYGAYGWVTVPAEDVTLLANEPLRIMATAADQLENPALKITCNDVYTFVQDFDCGVYFDEDFLLANAGLEATLELRIYNNNNEEESYRIGEIYSFKNPVVKDEETNVIVEGSKVADQKVEITNVDTENATEGTTTVTIDTTNYVDADAEAVNAVVIPKAAVDAVAELGAELEIVLSNGDGETTTVSIDQEALLAIQEAAGEAMNVTLTVEESETLTENQTTAVDNLDNTAVYSVYFETEDGTEVYSSDVAAGKIVVTINYEQVGSGKVYVKHLTDDGGLENVTYTYSNDVVTMELKHFSEYVIYQKSSGGFISSNTGSATKTHAVKFETNGGSIVAAQRVKENGVISEPAAPTKAGYTFEGWYTDETFETAYDFAAEVTKGFTLYAKWTEATEEPSTDEPATDEPATAATFTDVKAEDWFSEDVKFVSENGLMNGVTETEFAPETLLTRAMLVTILYRNEGEPATNRSIPFADIDMSAYYASAVIWAQQNGIVNGVTETEFAPDANITREQIAAIMFRYAVYKGLEAVTLEENLTAFADADEVSEYAISALNWAVGSGLINGKTESTLCPQDNATRAEIAAILHRYIASQE